MMLAGSCATDTSKYLRQGHKYAAAGEWDNSVRFFQKAHDEDPENTEINLMLKRSKFESSRMHMINGESYLAQELFNEAINEFRISMAMNPANTRAAELEGKAQRLGNCGRDAVHCVERRQGDEKNAVGIMVYLLRGGFEGHARLAAAAGTDQGQQTAIRVLQAVYDLHQ